MVVFPSPGRLAAGERLAGQPADGPVKPALFYAEERDLG